MDGNGETTICRSLFDYYGTSGGTTASAEILTQNMLDFYSCWLPRCSTALESIMIEAGRLGERTFSAQSSVPLFPDLDDEEKNFRMAAEMLKNLFR